MAEPAAPLDGRLYVADTSAWMRSTEPGVAAEWDAATLAGQILTTPVVVMELLYSARDAEDFASREARLDALREAPLSRGAVDAARSAMRELAQAGPLHHRVPVTDLLIAAAAAERGVGVLHCDRHYGRLAEVLGFESRRLIPPS